MIDLSYKTLLAKAVCGFNQSTFFSCASSSLISKYRGESEKIVRCLFDAARICAPSVVFLDEVDALVSVRGADGEHEASRRLKTEFFAQMDGITMVSLEIYCNTISYRMHNYVYKLSVTMLKRAVVQGMVLLFWPQQTVPGTSMKPSGGG